MAIVITIEDREMFRFIHDHGGIVHKDLLKKFRWQNATVSAMDKRLGPLTKTGWLRRREGDAVFNGLYWLGWPAILLVVSERGISVSEPARLDGNEPSENELGKLARRLKAAGIRWTDNPDKADHCRRLAEIQYAIESGCLKALGLELLRLEQFDQSHPSPTPDLFFAIGATSRRNQAARFSLEFDNTTHPLERLIKEKIVGGLVYLRSADRHKDKTGRTSGRWLFVFRSTSRMAEVQELTQKAIGNDAKLFLFTSYEEATNGDPIGDAIWHVGGSKERVRLLESG